MNARFVLILRALGLAIALFVAAPALQGCAKNSEPAGEHEGHDHSKGDGHDHEHEHGEKDHKHVEGDEKK